MTEVNRNYLISVVSVNPRLAFLYVEGNKGVSFNYEVTAVEASNIDKTTKIGTILSMRCSTTSIPAEYAQLPKTSFFRATEARATQITQTAAKYMMAFEDAYDKQGAHAPRLYERDNDATKGCSCWFEEMVINQSDAEGLERLAIPAPQKAGDPKSSTCVIL